MSVVMLCMGATFALKITGLGVEFAGIVRALTLFAFGTTGCMYLQVMSLKEVLKSVTVLLDYLRNVPNTCKKPGQCSYKCLWKDWKCSRAAGLQHGKKGFQG